MTNNVNRHYNIYSEKYDVIGTIDDYNVTIKLEFVYKGKKFEMAMDRPFPDSDTVLKENAIKTIETYIEELADKEENKRITMLHHWFIAKEEISGQIYGKGIVTGHNHISDATSIHTSKIVKIEVDEEKETAIIRTKNSIYHCPLGYCNFKRQDEYPDLLPEYVKIKEKYNGKRHFPSIEEGKVLLVLSNFDSYYFNSLFYRPENAFTNMDYNGYPHVGMFQDSFLVSTEDGSIDLRYFPHYQNIEFYMEDTGGMPFFIENIGDVVLYAKTSCGLLRLEPGERKEVKNVNAEEGKKILPGGDLYPAQVDK